MSRVLVTGVGGAAGVAVVRSLLARGDTDVFCADMDHWASGLYLVPADRRRLVPPGLAPDFVDTVRRMCHEDGIDVLFPTVDVELPRVAASRSAFEGGGTRVASPELTTIDTALDKLSLARACEGAGGIRVPRTELVTSPAARTDWRFPVIVKPRRGSGSRGIRVITSQRDLDDLVEKQEALADGASDLIVQGFLPGEEYSVDVLADLEGRVRAAVPRARLRVDSGISIAGITRHDPALIETASAIAQAIGLTTVANVQLKLDADDTPALLEVNPRFPGAMPLTIASGVDMPSLVLDAMLGKPLPEQLDFAEVANVRFLEDVFLTPEEVLPPR